MCFSHVSHQLSPPHSSSVLIGWISPEEEDMRVGGAEEAQLRASGLHHHSIMVPNSPLLVACSCGEK